MDRARAAGARRMRIVVVGSSILDVVARPTSRVARDTSNEGVVTRGRAARGATAENLARLGCRGTLVTDLGDDFAGRFLLDNIRELGIEARLSARSRTGVYLALPQRRRLPRPGFLRHRHGGHLAVRWMLNALPDLQDFHGAVIDANLSETAVAALAERCRRLKVPYAVESVAHERPGRALPAIPGCVLIKPDRAEARTLTGLPCDTRPRRLRAPGGCAPWVPARPSSAWARTASTWSTRSSPPHPRAPRRGGQRHRRGGRAVRRRLRGDPEGLPPRLAAEAEPRRRAHRDQPRRREPRHHAGAAEPGRIEPTTDGGRP